MLYFGLLLPVNYGLTNDHIRLTRVGIVMYNWYLHMVQLTKKIEQRKKKNK